MLGLSGSALIKFIAYLQLNNTFLLLLNPLTNSVTMQGLKNCLEAALISF